MNQMTLTIPYQNSVTRTYSRAAGGLVEEMESLHYSIEIPAEMDLRATNPNSKSISERLGHFNTDGLHRHGKKNTHHHHGIFRCIPQLYHAGEQL